MPSRKELHGWWKGKRECTGERMLVNPYNGCSVGCIFCYARALPAAYFRLFNETGIVTVFKDFDRVVADQLDSIDVASCGYLSPVCDPFQEVESVYGLSERIIEQFVERNIPVEFITKCEVPARGDGADAPPAPLPSGSSRSITAREPLRAALMKGGASVDRLFASMKKCAVAGLPGGPEDRPGDPALDRLAAGAQDPGRAGRRRRGQARGRQRRSTYRSRSPRKCLPTSRPSV